MLALNTLALVMALACNGLLQNEQLGFALVTLHLGMPLLWLIWLGCLFQRGRGNNGFLLVLLWGMTAVTPILLYCACGPQIDHSQGGEGLMLLDYLPMLPGLLLVGLVAQWLPMAQFDSNSALGAALNLTFYQTLGAIVQGIWFYVLAGGKRRGLRPAATTW
ncbi:hypothetical protein [Andreprevotia lacus]|uniref:hypothetical protein n=1 Tax=Andreprevotia lacus TaxID=1121000 RepID=UPI00111BFD57|nr:hypothetical protein [Andreprevotia lacus]